MATCIHYTRGKMCISLHSDLPRRAHLAIYTCLIVCHVYWPNTRGNLEVTKFDFFCSGSFKKNVENVILCRIWNINEKLMVNSQRVFMLCWHMQSIAFA
jgi:hypothetical protein